MYWNILSILTAVFAGLAAWFWYKSSKVVVPGGAGWFDAGIGVEVVAGAVRNQSQFSSKAAICAAIAASMQTIGAIATMVAALI